MKYLKEKNLFLIHPKVQRGLAPKGTAWAGWKSPKGLMGRAGLPCTAELPGDSLTGGSKGIPGHMQG